jgi:hypothetical protein
MVRLADPTGFVPIQGFTSKLWWGSARSVQIYPNGLPRGTKFSELEAIAGDLGEEIARQLIETNIRGQPEEWPDDELGECPSCGGPARKAPDQPFELITTRGDVA